MIISFEKNLIDKCNLLRKNVLESCYEYNNSHLSSCLSIVDIIGTLYFGGFDKDNDIILSKGHACLTQACAMKMCGYQNVVFSDHPERDENYLTTSGSLGFGIGVAVGIATAYKLFYSKRHVYCIVGDGECFEGLTLESLNYIRNTNIPITIIVDSNGYSAERISYDIESIYPNVQVVDGHLPLTIYNTLINKPKIIIASTIKGYGIPSIYDKSLLHYITPDDSNIDKFRKELEDNFFYIQNN